MLTTTLTKDYTDKPHESVPCPLCDAGNDAVLAERGYPGIPVRNVICKGCGLVRINPRMTREGYEAFYKEDFFEYLNPYGRPAYVETIERTTDPSFQTPAERLILPYILPYVKEGARVLDVGAGFGQIMYLLARDRNATCVGIEPDPYSRQVAKEKIGINLLDTTVEEFIDTTSDTFDFIYLDQVFEHLLTPLEVLSGLGRILAPKGVIYVGVPGTYNPAVSMDLFYQLAHTYNYTPATMDLFAQKSGFKIISIRDPEGAALEVLLTHVGAPYPEESESRRAIGSDWKDVRSRLVRKRIVNRIRGAAKRVLTSMFGTTFKERLRAAIDKAIRYRY